MRCLSCNCVLTDKEATRKYATSGTFIDLCDNCFSDVAEDIPSIDGIDNGHDDEYGQEEE